MKHYRFLAFLLTALLLVATGCGGSQRAKAEDPAKVVGTLIQRYYSYEDYESVCAISLSKAEVDAALATIKAAGNHFFTIKNDSSSYEKIEGSAPSLGKNETCVGVYAGKSVDSLSVQGYVIVALNATSDQYTVTQFVVQAMD